MLANYRLAIKRTKNKLNFSQPKQYLFGLLVWTGTTFENALQAENADLIRAAEDDYKFAETFRHVLDGFSLSSARRSDQRTTWQVGGGLSQSNVTSTSTSYNNDVKRSSFHVGLLHQRTTKQ